MFLLKNKFKEAYSIILILICYLRQFFYLELSFILKVEEKMCTFKSFILVHCTFAFKLYLPVVVLCTGTKPITFSKMSKLVKTPLIKILRYAIFVVSVLSFNRLVKVLI